MERSSSCYLNSVVILVFVSTMIYSCVPRQPEEILYKKVFTNEQQKSLAETLFNGAGTDLYYQGSVGERMIIKEGLLYDKNNAWGKRELGVPYLKRGMAVEADYYYQQAADNDPAEWAGYKAYCWLYFYRDYETTIRDATICDELTPETVDYPQATSVDYMRGLAHLRLDSLDKAIYFLEKHLTNEIKDVGIDYVEPMAFLTLAIAYRNNKQYEKSNQIFSDGIKHNPKVPELHFHFARLQELQGNKVEAKTALDLAETWLKKDYGLRRPYVEEFFAIYQEDLSGMKNRLGDKASKMLDF